MVCGRGRAVAGAMCCGDCNWRCQREAVRSVGRVARWRVWVCFWPRRGGAIWRCGIWTREISGLKKYCCGRVSKDECSFAWCWSSGRLIGWKVIQDGHDRTRHDTRWFASEMSGWKRWEKIKRAQEPAKSGAWTEAPQWCILVALA